MSGLPNRILAFIERSQNTKVPEPRVMKYGFKEIKLLNVPLHDRQANYCLVLAHHERHGTILALLWFMHVLDRQEYRKAMAKKYEIEAYKEELSLEEHPHVKEDDCHAFLFHEVIHPNFNESKDRNEAEQREDVHLVKYMDDDDVFLNRRVILDENISHLGFIFEGLGVPYLNIDKRLKGVSDETILTMGIRTQENDVLITRDVEFAQIAETLGVQVIRLTQDETTLDSNEKTIMLAQKMRTLLKELGFRVVSLSTLVMSDDELLTFLGPIENELLLAWRHFLENGDLPRITLNGSLSKKVQNVLLMLQNEDALTLSINDGNQQQGTLKVQHPLWERYLSLQADNVHALTTAPLFAFLRLLSSLDDTLELDSLLTKGLIEMKNHATIHLTRTGKSWHQLYQTFMQARDLAVKSDLGTLASAENLEDTTDMIPADVTKSRDQEDSGMKKLPRVMKRDRRTLVGSLLRARKTTKRRWISIPELEARWKKLKRPPELFYISLDSLEQDGIVSFNEENEVTLEKKAYRLEEFADLVLLHEISVRTPIHYLDMRKIFIDKGCSPQLFDAMVQKLKENGEIKEQKGYLSFQPKSKLDRAREDSPEKLSFRAYKYVVSDQHQRRTMEQIINYLERKTNVSAEEAKSIITSLLDKKILIKEQDENKNEFITRGPEGREFERIMTTKLKRKK